MLSTLSRHLDGKIIKKFIDENRNYVKKLPCFTFLSKILFESIILIQLYILRGSEMDLNPHRKLFKVGTRFAMSENGYTSHPEITNIELDELASTHISIA